MENLDSDLLRTFLAVADAGSITDGADQIHRSQSATSLQIKRLEIIVGKAVFLRHGRGIELSAAGRALIPVARDVTARLDLALREISAETVQGRLRLGVPDDHGKERLARIIADFARQHPHVELDVTCAMSTVFPEALKKRHLDLAVYEVETPGPNEELIYEDPTCWVVSAQASFSPDDRLPVALFDHACWWRDAAIRSLDARRKPYRLVYSSQSVSGVVAAVEAGVAVGLLGRSSLHSGLAVARSDFGFGPTPTSKLVISTCETDVTAPMAAMRRSIRNAFMDGAAN